MVQGAVRSWLGVVVSIGLVACGGAPAGDGDGGVPTPPAAPTNVTATPGPGYVDVAWEHDGVDVTGFVVERRMVVAAGALTWQQLREGPWSLTAAAGDGVEPVEVGSVDAESRSFRDASVASGETYRYAVKAVGAGGATSPAQESAEGGVTPAPPASGVGSNPDPTRYLAAIVRDGGTPVAAANVSGFLIAHDDAFLPWRMYANADDGGVAVLEDLEVRSSIPAGTYDVLIAAWAVSPNVFVFALYEDVAVPGSLYVDVRDARLVEVDVTLDPEAGHNALLEFGRQVRGWTLFSQGVSVESGGASVLLEPGRYETFTWYDWRRDEPAMLIDQVDLTIARAIELTLDDTSLVSVIADATLPATVADATTRVCLSDARDRHLHLGAFCPDASLTRASPIVATVDADVVIDEDSGERFLRWGLGRREIGPPGGEVVVSFGGAIVAEIETAVRTYAPGDTVQVTGSVRDEHGNPLELVYTVRRSPFRLESVPPTMVVVDAIGDSVYEDAVQRVTPSWGPDFTLADDAEPGEYIVAFSWDTGAYQGLIEATTTFDVVMD